MRREIEGSCQTNRLHDYITNAVKSMCIQRVTKKRQLSHISVEHNRTAIWCQSTTQTRRQTTSYMLIQPRQSMYANTRFDFELSKLAATPSMLSLYHGEPDTTICIASCDTPASWRWWESNRRPLGTRLYTWPGFHITRGRMIFQLREHTIQRCELVDDVREPSRGISYGAVEPPHLLQ